MTQTNTPIRMRLFCEGCHAQHIDLGDFATKLHHTHQCHNCGMCWRPAVENTVGVRYLFSPEEYEPITIKCVDVTPETSAKIKDTLDRARISVIEMCPSNECQIRQVCTRCKGACRLRPPLDEIAQGDR